MRRIGILGGSFDPIHNTHLNIARSAYEDYHLDEVWLIPAGHSPNKDESKMTAPIHRLKMTELAISGIPHFKVLPIEILRQETSYTYLTLTRLKDEYPDDSFYFIMGADSLDYFEKWVHPEIICQKAVILVAVRDNLDINAINAKIQALKLHFEGTFHTLSATRSDISSTSIRHMVAIGDDISSFVPDDVQKYIIENNLYT
jgi:nicotinate-nucleotide adenylyltransferase